MVDLPLDLREGDTVRLLGAGAYTTCYSTVGFNGFPPLPTHLRPREPARLAVARQLASYAAASVAMSLPWPLLLVLAWDRYGDGPHGPLVIGLVGAARMVPYVLLSWAVGSLGDRIRRERLLAATLVLRLGFLGVVAVAVAADRLALAVIAAALAIACGTPAYPTVAAAMPSWPVRRAGARTEALVTIEVAAWVVGPALGGLLLQPGDPPCARCRGRAHVVAVRTRLARAAPRAGDRPAYPGPAPAWSARARHSGRRGGASPLRGLVNVVAIRDRGRAAPAHAGGVDECDGGFGLATARLGLRRPRRPAAVVGPWLGGHPSPVRTRDPGPGGRVGRALAVTGGGAADPRTGGCGGGAGRVRDHRDHPARSGRRAPRRRPRPGRRGDGVLRDGRVVHGTVVASTCGNRLALLLVGVACLVAVLPGVLRGRRVSESVQILIRAEVGSYIGRSDTSTGYRTPAMSTSQVPAFSQSGVTGSPRPETMARPTAPPRVQPYDAART